MKICVYCSSSDALADEYYLVAKQFARTIVENGHELVYGGAKVGVMGVLARETKRLGGRVTGIMPRKIFDKNLALDGLDEFVVTEDMHTRKSKLEEASDAFIALPGGLGTLEELAEVLTLKQLDYHSKPVVIFNMKGFYDNLLAFFETMFERNFSKADYQKMYLVTDKISESFEYLENYQAPVLESKWFRTNLNLD